MKVRRSWLVLLAGAAAVTGLLTGCGGTKSPSIVTDTTIEAVPSTTIQQWSGPEPTPPALFPARQDGKWGFIDRTGRLVIDFQYEEAWDFSDGMAAVRVGDRWGFIDESGAMTIAPQFARVGPFFDGRAQLVTGAGVGYIDKTGRIVIPPEFEGSYQFHEGLAGVRLEKGYGYIDTAGTIVIRLPLATSVGDFSEGLASVRIGTSGYIDREGRFVIKEQFDSATEFSNGSAVVEYGFQKYALIDRSGQVLRKLDYDQVGRLKEGRAAVGQGGLDLDALLEDGDLQIREGGWGFMDESGALVIPAQFKIVQDFSGGLARVEDQNGEMAYVDLDGNYVWREH